MYYLGLSLAANSTMDSGIAVIDSSNEIIMLDKLYSMKDVQHFFDNFTSLKHSKVCISLPWDNSMLNGKWRILSKPYQQVTSCKFMLNVDNWTQRYSARGSEYFYTLKQRGIDIKRVELYMLRQRLNLGSYFKERTPADCKFLQNILRIEHGFESLPTNMLPMAQLEGIVCAMAAKSVCCTETGDFKGLEIVVTNN